MVNPYLLISTLLLFSQPANSGSIDDWFLKVEGQSPQIGTLAMAFINANQSYYLPHGEDNKISKDQLETMKRKFRKQVSQSDKKKIYNNVMFYLNCQKSLMKDVDKISFSLRNTSSLSEIFFNSDTKRCMNLLPKVPGFHPAVGTEYNKMVTGFLRMKNSETKFSAKDKKLMISFAESQVTATRVAFKKIDKEIKDWFR